MKCLTPIVRSVVLQYEHDKRGVVHPADTMYVLCPCGKCVPCLLADQRDWALRLQLQAEMSQTAWFVTLTYDDSSLPQDFGVHKSEVQRFMNSLRKKMERIYKELGSTPPHLLYFGVGEYGRRRGRPHYHLMVYNMPAHSVMEMHTVCAAVWSKGFVKVEWCNSQTANYIAKYMTKLDPREHPTKPFRLMSRRPAIGYDYFSRDDVREYINRDEVNFVHTKDGKRYRIPRSVKRKFYSAEKVAKNRQNVLIDEEVLCVKSPALSEYIRQGREINERLRRRVFERYS